LQHMDGRLLRKGSLYLDPSDLIMNENRRAKIHQLFENVHEDIFEEQRKVLQRQKKDNYELISQKLNLYLWRTEDLITQFRRLDLSLLSQEYLEEYNQTIYHYNALINDFLENHCKYESDFRNIWGADLGEKLQHSFEKILDFHERYMFKSLNRRNEQIPRFAQPQNKKEKQDLKNDLEKGKREFEETMADQWPIVKSGIEQFLRDLP